MHSLFGYFRGTHVPGGGAVHSIIIDHNPVTPQREVEVA